MQWFFASSAQKTVDIQKSFVCRIFGLQRTRLDSWYILVKKSYDLCGFWWEEAIACKRFSKFVFRDALVMTVWQLKLYMPVSNIRIFASHNKIEDIFLGKLYFTFSTISYQYEWVQVLQTQGCRRGGNKAVACFSQKVIDNSIFFFPVSLLCLIFRSSDQTIAHFGW